MCLLVGKTISNQNNTPLCKICLVFHYIWQGNRMQMHCLHIAIASCGCRVTEPSDANFRPVKRSLQGAGIKQLNRIWLHVIAFVKFG